MKHRHYQDEWLNIYMDMHGGVHGRQTTRERFISTLHDALEDPFPAIDHISWFAAAPIFEESELTFEAAYDNGWEWDEHTMMLKKRVKLFLSSPRLGPLNPEDWL